ncbi:MAG: PqqD family peptide modification chaperone [Sedimentisphaerales bacterium]|nr:PqqD family peptide modification chaperone [Sedimentisphaerales bacterium]
MTDPFDHQIVAVGQGEAEDRALPRARRDIEVTEQVYDGKPCYVLKDPVTLRYYRLRPPEYVIWKLLDGENNLDDVLHTLAERFPNDNYDQQAVMSFMIMLRGANLLHVPGETQTDYLLDRKKKLTRSIFTRIRQEFLFFRISLLDPDKLLEWLHRHLGGFIFSRLAAILVMVLMAGAVYLLLDNIDKLGERQPLLSWINLLYLGPALLVIKFIHEFGHGLTSKHFGSEVHEMGILFLVFMPCFYCDVSDAWMVPSKTRRMWITAAGILVELTLAALATYVWAITEPKTIINQFALNVMIAASLNTLLFNGNPLLRYDGYYFLMDLMEIPNLKSKSSQYLWYLLQHYVLGVEEATPPADVKGREPGILIYAVCSTLYRWFIMFAIVSMVWHFLDPYGWGVIGAVMALGCIYSSLIKPLGNFARFVFKQHHRLHIRLATAATLVVLTGGLIYGVLILDVEQSVEAQCILRPSNIQRLYVAQPGFIDPELNPRWIQDGQHVNKDDVLLVLSNPELVTRRDELKLQRDQANEQLRLARQTNATDEAARLEKRLDGLQARFERAEKHVQDLTIRAPRDGVVQLLTTEPLEVMQGRFLPVSTALFAVYEPGKFEAVAAVSERDIGDIAPEQRVQIKLWPFDDEELETKVEVKPPDPVRRMSSPAFSTAYGGEVLTMPAEKAEDTVIPAINTYEIELPINHVDMRLRDGMIGRAKFIIQERTLGGAIYRWLMRTLALDFKL